MAESAFLQLLNDFEFALDLFGVIRQVGHDIHRHFQGHFSGVLFDPCQDLRMVGLLSLVVFRSLKNVWPTFVDLFQKLRFLTWQAAVDLNVFLGYMGLSSKC